MFILVRSIVIISFAVLLGFSSATHASCLARLQEKIGDTCSKKPKKQLVPVTAPAMPHAMLDAELNKCYFSKAVVGATYSVDEVRKFCSQYAVDTLDEQGRTMLLDLAHQAQYHHFLSVPAKIWTEKVHVLLQAGIPIRTALTEREQTAGFFHSNLGCKNTSLAMYIRSLHLNYACLSEQEPKSLEYKYFQKLYKTLFEVIESEARDRAVKIRESIPALGSDVKGIVMAYYDASFGT